MKHTKIAVALIFFMLMSKVSEACVTCNKKIREAIFDRDFMPNLFLMLSPFLVLALVVAGLSVLSAKRHKKGLQSNANLLTPVPLSTAAMVLGIGLGGFVDGIVLHQILQWHEMVSNRLPPVDFVSKSVNMFWDGIFHAFTLLVTVTGCVLMWRLLARRDINRSGWLFSGGLLTGWALFNIIEGIADHHLLKLHNVREVATNVEAWNYGFLGVSVVMLLIGIGLIGKASSRHAKED